MSALEPSADSAPPIPAPEEAPPRLLHELTTGMPWADHIWVTTYLASPPPHDAGPVAPRARHRLVIGNSADASMEVWDAQTGERLAQLALGEAGTAGLVAYTLPEGGIRFAWVNTEVGGVMAWSQMHVGNAHDAQ
jgi:hypothetical protein